MWIYLFNIITIPIYSRIFKNRKVFVTIVGLQLFLILALRSVTLGVDLPNYKGGYEYIGGLEFDDILSRLNIFGTANLIYPYNYESGYAVFNWFLSHIGLNFHGFLVACAIINTVSISWFIYRYSKKPWLSFVIFSTFGFFAYDFGIIRQSLALSMVLLSYIQLDKKKRFASIISFLVALNFHRTSIIALPLLLIHFASIITKKRFLILLILSALVIIFSSFIYNNIIVNIMSYMGKSGHIGHDATMNNMLLLLYFIAILVIIFYNFSRIKDKVNSVACYALAFAIYFSIFGLYNDVLARALQYFSVFLVIIIPETLDQYKDQKIIILIETGIYLLLAGLMYYNISGSAIDPYIFNDGGFLW